MAKQGGAVLRCYGAVQTVTGSAHVVEANGDRVLLDCGLYQGRRNESRERNRELPFHAESITSVVLSHAHIDHCGNLPTLVKRGFQGHIYATPATRDLAEILLQDSAHIQAKDAEFYNKKAARRGDADRIEPLYSAEDAMAALDRFIEIPYGHEVEVGRGVHSTFHDAAHIIGSASVALRIEVDGQTRRLTFTGDFGRKDMPILRNPEPLAPADLILSESTYGGRFHAPYQEEEQILKSIIQRTADRGGKVIVPAFSVGRTQNLVYWLHILFSHGELPNLPIFVDSPLSSKATLVYRGHPECYDRETHEAFLRYGEDPFGFRRLRYVTSTDGSKALNELQEPCVIISASGMCEAGRILHHLKHNITDRRSTILIVGFTAEHTLGRRLADEAEDVKIYGEVYPRRAEVQTMHGLSAHADQRELLEAFQGIEPAGRRRAVLVHGERDANEAMKQALAEIGTEAKIPRHGEPIPI